jgi:NAD binding domain of 6-phosphogluconate dehydrogenase
MLDTPVSGSVPQVQAGTLTIMVGGEEDAYRRVEHVLRVLGVLDKPDETWFDVGLMHRRDGRPGGAARVRTLGYRRSARCPVRASGLSRRRDPAAWGAACPTPRVRGGVDQLVASSQTRGHSTHLSRVLERGVGEQLRAPVAPARVTLAAHAFAPRRGGSLRTVTIRSPSASVAAVSALS